MDSTRGSQPRTQAHRLPATDSARHKDQEAAMKILTWAYVIMLAIMIVTALVAPTIVFAGGG